DKTEACRRAALDREGIERVEAAERPLPNPPALGRGRIDPVEMREVGPVMRLADQGQGVVLSEVIRGQRSRTAEDEQAREDDEEPAVAGHQVHMLQACCGRKQPDEYAGARTKRQVNPCPLRPRLAIEVYERRSSWSLPALGRHCGSGVGLSDSLRRKTRRSASSALSLTPANAIRLPGMSALGSCRYLASSSNVQSPGWVFMA